MSETKISIVQHAIDIATLTNVRRRMAKLSSCTTGAYFITKTINTLHNGSMQLWIESVLYYEIHKKSADQIVQALRNMSTEGLAEFIRNWIAIFPADAKIDG